MNRAEATVRVPASTTNLGPGFDALGVALRLYNDVHVKALDGSGGAEIVSGVSNDHVASANKLVTECLQAFAAKTEKELPTLEVDFRGDVPISRGLGSSVTIRLGLVAALNQMYGGILRGDEIINLVTKLEGHPDNTVASYSGGFTAASMLGEEVRFVRMPISKRYKFVTLIPEQELATSEARNLLPATVEFKKAVQNISRTALLVAALAMDEPESLNGIFEDNLHQPYRAKMIPGLFETIAAGVAAGAHGGWLSGAGSSIVCLTTRTPEEVLTAMQGAFQKTGGTAKGIVLEADAEGLQVIS